MTALTDEQKLARRTHEGCLAAVPESFGPGRVTSTLTVWGTPEVSFMCRVHAPDDPESDGLIFCVAEKDPTQPRWGCRSCTFYGDMDWREFLTALRDAGMPDAALPLSAGGSAGSSARHTRTVRPRAARAVSRLVVALPDEDELSVYAEFLHDRQYQDRLRYLTDERMWSPADIERFGVGWSPYRRRYTFAQRDESGHLVNVRWWAPSAPKKSRWLHTTGHGKQARSWPLPPLLGAAPGSAVYVCGGEADAMAALARGVVAITGPGGETRRLKPEDIALLVGHRVHVIYDSDGAGRRGGAVVADSLVVAGCTEVWIHDLYPDNAQELAPGTPKDLTDWLRDGGEIPT